MVKREISAYLFLGQDILDQENASLKEKELNKIKALLPKQTRDFNLDTLHCSDRSFNLRILQEKLLFLPAAGSERIVIVRNIQEARPEVKDFLSGYVKDPTPGIILVLDADQAESKNAFIDRVSPYCRVSRFRIEFQASTFSLARLIDARKAGEGLKVLRQLLDNGEKPERIMGGLRASWIKYPADPLNSKKRLKLLLQCDLEIKTGKIKPQFALERLIVKLCSFGSLPG